MGRPRRIVINKVLTDKETSNLEGQWIDEIYMKHPLINFNVDVCIVKKMVQKNFYFNKS